ncbi:serine hydrolase [Aureibacillus halotolerans]|nr:serine hydrolase [Aureibacillus halotolerans]
MIRRDRFKTKNDVITFMKNHPEKWSMTRIEDGQITLDHNGKALFPLASTVKLIYAVAFVRAVKEGEVSLDEEVPSHAVDLFYYEHTDGGAHKRWKDEEKIKAVVSIKQIAKGMMTYSSNACTEYMHERLGVARLNAVLHEYHLNDHTPLLPLSLFLIPSYLHIEEKLSTKQIRKRINEMSSDELRTLAIDLHDKAKSNEVETIFPHLGVIADRSIQREISAKLPASTSSNYARFIDFLGSSDHLSSKEKELLDDIMGTLESRHDSYRFWYKGGSTQFILTSTVYRQRSQKSVAFSFFIYDQEGLDILWLNRVYREFLTSFMEDETFRDQVIKEVPSAPIVQSPSRTND